MIRSEIKKKAQMVLHGKYGNWSVIVLAPFIIGLLFFILSLFFVSNSSTDYNSNQYESWQGNEHGTSSRRSSDFSDDDAYQEGYEDGYSRGYDEGWNDGWDDSLLEDSDYDDELDEHESEKLNTLANTLQPFTQRNSINQSQSYMYRNQPGGMRLGGLFFFLFSLFFSFLLVLYDGLLKWAAIDTISGVPFTLKTVFEDFMLKHGKKVVVANFWVALYTFLWTLLFIIPGIVKGAAYSMTNYLMKRDEQLSAKEAIILSQQLMKGYKIEYLILRISFIFWSYVTMLSFGLASFYVLPYISVTEALFFDQIIQDKHHVFTSEKEAGFEDF